MEEGHFEEQVECLLAHGPHHAGDVVLFVPPASQKRRPLRNALFKEELTAEVKLLFMKHPDMEEPRP